MSNSNLKGSLNRWFLRCKISSVTCVESKLTLSREGLPLLRLGPYTGGIAWLK